MRDRFCSALLLRCLSLGAALGPAAIACSDDAEPSRPSATDGGEPVLPDLGFADVGFTDTGITGGAEVDLTGTWASLRVASQCFSGPLGLDRVLFYWVAKHTITQADTTAQLTTEVCDLTLTPYQGSATTYPAAAIAAFDARGAAAALSGTTEGSAFVTADELLLLGWAPTTNPVEEMLPQDDMDDRLRDADNDGNPGVTLNIMGFVSGDVYIASRNAMSTTGVIVDEDRITGTVRAVSTQWIVGASAFLLENNTTTVTPDPRASASPFEMVRLSGDPSCADVLAGADQLFTLTGTVTDSDCPL